MRTSLKVILASIGTAMLLACPAVAGDGWHSYYAPYPYYYNASQYYPQPYYYAPHYGYGYFGAPFYYRGWGALGNPSLHLGNCVRRAFPQCSGGN
jgi:hypothetical protein